VVVGVTSGGEAPCEWGVSWDTRVDVYASWVSSVANGDVVKPGGNVTTPPPDTQVPSVRINSPARNAVVSRTITVRSQITDNVGVVKGELWVDGVLKQTKTQQPYNFTVTLSPGARQLRVIGRDAAGNAGRSTINVRVQ
jgi:hypothetical protein